MTLEKVISVLARTCTVLGALAVGVMMVATCWDVVARQVANAPLRGLVELVEIMVLASAMLGLPEAFLRDEHIGVDLVDTLLPPKAVVILKAFSGFLTILLLGILAKNTLQPTLDAHRFGDLKYDLGIPLYPLYGLIIVAFCLSMLCAFAVLLRLFVTKEKPA